MGGIMGEEEREITTRSSHIDISSMAKWTEGALAGMALVLFLITTQEPSRESYENILLGIAVLCCLVACAISIGTHAIKSHLSDITRDLQSLSWCECDDIVTENSELCFVDDVFEIQLGVIRLLSSLREFKPYLPDSVLCSFENNISNPTDDDASSEDVAITPTFLNRDASPQSEQSHTGEAMFLPNYTLGLSAAEAAAQGDDEETCSMSRCTTNPMNTISALQNSPFQQSLQPSPKSIRFNLAKDETPESVVEIIEPMQSKRKQSLLPNGSMSDKLRRPSVGDCLAAIRRVSRSDVGRRFSTGRRQSTVNRKHSVSSEVDDAMTGGAAGHLYSHLKGNMKKKKGTICSVEFGIMDLEHHYRDVQELYELASALQCFAMDTVKNEGGNLLHLQADSLIASWNSHQTCVLHAYHGCRAALGIRRSMEAVSGGDRVGFCVSITSGPIYCGNIGNDRHRSPFVLGGLVEESRMLNQLSRVIQAPLLISETVSTLTRETMICRPIDMISGPNDSTRQVVYELLNSAPTRSKTTEAESASEWKSMFTKFVNGQYAEIDRLPCLVYDSDEEEGDDIQQQRFQNLVAAAQDDDLHLPTPYCRKILGWQEWEEDPTFGESSYPRNSRPRGSRCSSSLLIDIPPRQDSTAEFLRSAINDCRTPIKLEEESSDVSDESVFDEPPTQFTDRHGSSWQRSPKRCLGKGAFGEVWLGMSSEGSLVALKCMKIPSIQNEVKTKFGRKRNTSAESLESYVNEVSQLIKFRDDSIVSFISCGVYERYVVITMEYVSGGSLASVLEQFGTIKPLTAKRYTKDILKGLHYLHGHNVIHRDLKPGNVLLHTDGQCKLSDFGTCVAMTEIETGGTLIGTPLFMSPEACRNETCTASDMWALGLTIIQMLLGGVSTPYAYCDEVPASTHRFLRWLCQEDGDVPLPSTDEMSEEAINCVARVLKRNPEDRASAEQLLIDPFVI